jgi:hypothetical protein
MAPVEAGAFFRPHRSQEIEAINCVPRDSCSRNGLILVTFGLRWYLQLDSVDRKPAQSNVSLNKAGNAVSFGSFHANCEVNVAGYFHCAVGRHPFQP